MVGETRKLKIKRTLRDAAGISLVRGVRLPSELIWMNVCVRERIATRLLEREEVGRGGDAD